MDNNFNIFMLNTHASLPFFFLGSFLARCVCLFSLVHAVVAAVVMVFSLKKTETMYERTCVVELCAELLE